jgi:hypothetical protein
MPKVSVILPTYNGLAEGLGPSVDSILGQTFRDLELIVVVDGSQDGTLEWLESRQTFDSRLRVVHHATNEGLLRSLIDGAAVASAPWLARQDQDDLSAPDRLSSQMAFLDRHPGVCLVGTSARVESTAGINGNTRFVGTLAHPPSNAAIRWRLVYGNPFVHSSVVLSRRAYEAVGGYARTPTGDFPEDLDLWARMAMVAPVANLKEALVTYRQRPNGLSSRQAEEIRVGTLAICQSYALELLSSGDARVSRQAVCDLVSALLPGTPAAVASHPSSIRRSLTQIRGALKSAGLSNWLEFARARLLLERGLRRRHDHCGGHART